MNFATSLCRRLNLSELVTNAPAYSSATGTNFILLDSELNPFSTSMKMYMFSRLTWSQIYYYTDVTGGGLSLMFRRWATKKTAGSTRNGRDSKPKNLGVKKFGGEVRQ